MPYNSPIVIKDFSKKYRDLIAVDNLNLEVSTSEVFGFLGPNGAGKTTTIRTMLNFVSPTSGSISIFGLDSVTDDMALKHRIGYLPGDISLYDSMNGNQFLKYLTALGKKTDWGFVQDLSEKLQAPLDRKIGGLSKGNIQKIGLIQAFMHKPDLLILDEPTSGLDPLMKQVFYDMVLQMKVMGKTIFISSHDLTEVQKLCDRAAFIREGKLIAIEEIKNSFDMNLRRYTITFESEPNQYLFTQIEGVTEAITDGNQITVTIRGNVSHLIEELSKLAPTDLYEQETTLEDLFMKYY